MYIVHIQSVGTCDIINPSGYQQDLWNQTSRYIFKSEHEQAILQL